MCSTILLMAIGCSKSKNEKRISDGIWVVKNYTVNGVDSTASALYEDIDGYKFVLDGTRKNRKENYIFDRIYVVMKYGQEFSFGHWGERDDNKMLLIPEYAFMENIPTRPFLDCGCFPKYDIEYIHKNEMKYTIEYDGTNYNVTFEKK